MGAAATLVPLIDQMNPDASIRAAGGPVDFDLSKVQLGQQVTVRWRDKPVFIVNQPPETLQTLQDTRLLERLLDPNSIEHQQPPYAQNWHRSVKPEYAVLVGICTHLGCIPHFYPQPSAGFPTASWRSGYFCTCHGSIYDLAGGCLAAFPHCTICPRRRTDF